MIEDVEHVVLLQAANDDRVGDDGFRLLAAAFRGDGALEETLVSLRSERERGETT